MTKTYATLQRGQFHDQFCEDFYIIETIGIQRQLLAVMDGCSMGKESTFASMLLGKLLRRIARDEYYGAYHSQATIDLKAQLRLVTYRLFDTLKHMKNQLGLATEELLCTLNMALVDKENHRAECVVIGDGLICHDGRLHDFEQANRPDYLGYHLGEDFDRWYADQEQKVSVYQFEDLALTTDGIFTFQSQQKYGAQKPQETINRYLLVDQSGFEQQNFLDRKIRSIANEWQHQAMDDLAMVRVIKSLEHEE